MTKRFYESYIIIDGNLDDATIEDVIKKYESFLLKNESEIKNIERIGRKRLSYQIKKKQNGFYVCFEFQASSPIINKIERSYKLDENILRYLTIYISSKTKREKEDHIKNKAIIQANYEALKNKEKAVLEDKAEDNVHEVFSKGIPDQVINS